MKGEGVHLYNQCKQETAAERDMDALPRLMRCIFWRSTYAFMRCCIEGSTCETRDGLSRLSSKLCELPLGFFGLSQRFQYCMRMYELLFMRICLPVYVFMSICRHIERILAQMTQRHLLIRILLVGKTW